MFLTLPDPTGPLPYIHFTYISLRLPVRGTRALEIKEIFVRQLPHDGSRDALVIVAQQVADAGAFFQGISGLRIFRSSGK